METKYKNPNHLVQMSWQELTPEKNYGSDVEDYREPLNPEIKRKTIELDDLSKSNFNKYQSSWTTKDGKEILNINFDTSLFQNNDWYNYNDKIPINLGTTSEFTKKYDEHSYYDYIDRKDKEAGCEDLMRSLTIMGVEDVYNDEYFSKRKKIGSKSTEIISVSFTEQQGVALNYLFRAMENRIEKLQHSINEYYVEDQMKKQKKRLKEKQLEKDRDEKLEKELEELSA